MFAQGWKVTAKTQKVLWGSDNPRHHQNGDNNHPNGPNLNLHGPNDDNDDLQRMDGDWESGSNVEPYHAR